MSDIPAVNYTVSANYIQNAPDLQIRLYIRAMVNGSGVGDGLSDAEIVEILRSEADRVERYALPEGAVLAGVEP